MSRLAEYLLQNEEIRKRHNEELQVGVPPDFVMHLTCECGDDECTDTIEATLAEWQDFHQTDLVFMVAPNHYFPVFENILKKLDRFWIIQKKEERLGKERPSVE